MSRLSDVWSKYTDEYLSKVAVLDRCRMFLVLDAEYRVARVTNPTNAAALEAAVKRELTDLYLLLEGIVSEESIRQRLDRFKEERIKTEQS